MEKIGVRELECCFNNGGTKYGGDITTVEWSIMELGSWSDVLLMLVQNMEVT